MNMAFGSQLIDIPDHKICKRKRNNLSRIRFLHNFTEKPKRNKYTKQNTLVLLSTEIFLESKKSL